MEQSDTQDEGINEGALSGPLRAFACARARTNLGAHSCSETEAAGGPQKQYMETRLKALSLSLSPLSLLSLLALAVSGLWDLKIP